MGMSVTHKLKCLPNYFDAIDRGDKNFDVRRDDRGFQKGDVVILQKYSVEGGYHRDPKDVHKSHQIDRTIKYILTGGQFGIEPGYVVLGF